MRKFLVSGFIFICLVSNAQFFVTGDDPGNLHWYHIKTTHFDAVFSEDFIGQAQRVANIFEYCYDRDPKTMFSIIPRTPLLIHSTSCISNGITSWAPRRIELYPVPSQSDMYTQDWIEQLAVHEFRHISQFNKMNIGFGHITYLLLGQMINALAAGTLPSYFFEGDAVLTETALTRAGRGRQPWFQMETRAILLEKKKLYSYRKSSLGSYKDWVPDIYQLGFLYVASARDRFGYGVWDKTLNFVGKNYELNLLGYPVYSMALKKTTGDYRRAFYKKTFMHLNSLWLEQDMRTYKTPLVVINKTNNKSYTSYRFPATYKNNIIVQKSGLDQHTLYVKILPDGQEKILYEPGVEEGDNLSVSKSLMVWNEYVPDLRWAQRTFTVVKTMDLETGKIKTLSHHTRYFYPIVSPDASKIAVVEYTQDHHHAITILDSQTGQVLSRNLSPGNLFPMNPCWDEDSKHILLIVVSDFSKSIQRLDPTTNQWRMVYKPDSMEIYQLYSQKGIIFFRSGYSGIENIYAFNPTNNNTYQVTSSRFGAFDPFVNSDKIYYADYSSNGYNLVYNKIDTSQWKILSSVTSDFVDLTKRAAKEEGEVVDSSVIPDSAYQIKRYHKFSHLINIHSWTPFYYDWTDITPNHNVPVIPGATLFSQNLLGTAILYLGGAYQSKYNFLASPNQPAPLAFTGITFTGFYPVINLQASYGGSQLIATYGSHRPLDTLESKNLFARVYFPLNLSRGRFITIVQPEWQLTYNNELVYDRFSNHFLTGIDRDHYRIQAEHYLQESYRDLFPSVGTSIDIYYSHCPGLEYLFNSTFYFKGVVYLPGLFNHQGFRLTLAQETHYYHTDMYNTAGTLLPARGYDYVPQYLTATEFYNSLKLASIDCFAPIIYPDLNVLGIIFIKRIWGNLFYDYSTVAVPASTNPVLTNTNTYRSTGFELNMDFNFLHFTIPLRITYRQAYLIDGKQYAYSFYLQSSYFLLNL